MPLTNAARKLLLLLTFAGLVAALAITNASGASSSPSRAEFNALKQRVVALEAKAKVTPTCTSRPVPCPSLRLGGRG